MKKEVQALINRRRARMVPVILAGLAVVIVLGGLAFVLWIMGPGQILLKGTPTPTPSLTFTPTPPPPTATFVTPTPSDTPVPTITPGPSPTPTVFVYVVQEYDTLSGIAEEFKVDVEVIKLVNNLTSDTLSIGQKLVIPAGDVPTITPSPIPTGLPRGTKIKYKVVRGDTLESIAAQFNSRVEDIVKANADPKNPKNVLSNTNLRAGAEIFVPINLVTPTPTPRPTATPKA
jgi:LysM repeat protein